MTEFKQWIFDLAIDVAIAVVIALMGIVQMGDGLSVFKRPLVILAILSAALPVIKAARRSLPRKIEEKVEARAEAKAQTLANSTIRELVKQGAIDRRKSG